MPPGMSRDRWRCLETLEKCRANGGNIGDVPGWPRRLTAIPLGPMGDTTFIAKATGQAKTQNYPKAGSKAPFPKKAEGGAK